MAATANTGGLLAEQVWDDQPPAGRPGFAPGTPTFSATPLGWAHGQYLRLAWSMARHRSLSTPSIVADRYPR
jgi:glucoamylase